jgi:hypothetical protein
MLNSVELRELGQGHALEPATPNSEAKYPRAMCLASFGGDAAQRYCGQALHLRDLDGPCQQLTVSFGRKHSRIGSAALAGLICVASLTSIKA